MINSILSIAWLVLAIAAFVHEKKQGRNPEECIPVWGFLIIANIWISSI